MIQVIFAPNRKNVEIKFDAIDYDGQPRYYEFTDEERDLIMTRLEPLVNEQMSNIWYNQIVNVISLTVNEICGKWNRAYKPIGINVVVTND